MARARAEGAAHVLYYVIRVWQTVVRETTFIELAWSQVGATGPLFQESTNHRMTVITKERVNQ